MSDADFDVIVVGAGMAGICCAGELVLQGVRPLLISETKEVGAALKGHVINEDTRAVMQVPTYQVAWGGGWWPHLVRRLNVPVKVPLGFNCVGYDLFIRGLPAPELQQSALSASSFVGVLHQAFPLIADQLGDGLEDLERVLGVGLAIPYEELTEMHDVSLAQWLEDQKADEAVANVIMLLTCAALGTTAAFCREYASVFGAFGTLRSLFCSEATYGFPYPDAREGLAIPVAREIERRGGTIWRRRRVARVIEDGERVSGVVMADGTEARAPMVAFACGVERLAGLFHLPPEVEAVVQHSKNIAHQDYHAFAVLDKPVVPPETNRWIGVFDPDGTMVQWIAPLHALAPWTTKPGQQLVASAMCRPVNELPDDPEGIIADLHEVTNSYFPGYREATCATSTHVHKPGHLWFNHLSIGPKLPRRSDSIEGLWFVNEASTPICGTFMEAAASAGILGARAMAEHRKADAS